MSHFDQPKPALPPLSKEYLANEHDAKHFNQPKPTGERSTEEWTEQTVKNLLDVIASRRLQRQNVANAHNAELAAVQDSLCNAGQMLIERDTVIDQLHKQLAAEREMWEKETANYRQRWNKALTEATQQLQDQLAAEREKVQTLVAAMRQIGLLADSRDKGDTMLRKLEAIARRCEKELANVGTYPLPDGRTK